MKKRSTQWHTQLEKKVLSDPEARAEYEAFKVQLELADKMKDRDLWKSIALTLQEKLTKVLNTSNN